MYITPEEQAVLDLAEAASAGATLAVDAALLARLFNEVVAYRRRLHVFVVQPTDADLYGIAMTDSKIAAVKLARHRHGLGLKEALDYVNTLLANPPAGAVEAPAERPDQPGQEG